MHNDWRIEKSVTYRGKWDIEVRTFRRIDREDGYVGWEMVSNWHHHSVAETKRAALMRIMMLKGRNEIVTWEGGPIKISPQVVIHPSEKSAGA